MKNLRMLTSAVALAIGMTTAASCVYAEGKTYAVIPVGMDTFGVAVGRGFTKAAEANGDKAIVIDSKWSVENMGNSIDDLIAQKVDGIAIAPADGIVAMAWVDKIVASKIPVVAVSTAVGDLKKQAPTFVYPGLFAYVNHDDTVTGAISAELAVPLLPKNRKSKVAIVNGSPGIVITDLRIKGFLDGLKAAGVDFEVVADQPTDWSPEKGEAVCQNILTATPDVDMFFTMADPLGIGCSHAVQTGGSKAHVVSTAGGMKTSNEEIAAGNIVGTTCVKPESMGRMAAEQLILAASDPKAEAGKYIGYQLTKVTKDTVASCTPEW